MGGAPCEPTSHYLTQRRYGGETAYRVLSKFLLVDILILDKTKLLGGSEVKKMDPHQRGGSCLTFIAHSAFARAREISVAEAKECASSEEPPVVVEHSGVVGASAHFEGFFSSRREAYPTPRGLQAMLDKCGSRANKRRKVG